MFVFVFVFEPGDGSGRVVRLHPFVGASSQVVSSFLAWYIGCFQGRAVHQVLFLNASTLQSVMFRMCNVIPLKCLVP